MNPHAFQDSVTQELYDVARQAVEYARDHANKPRFVARAEDVLIVARAVEVGRVVGLPQGWDVFEIGGGTWTIQADDDLNLIDDDRAIELAELAGLSCDVDGHLIGTHGRIIKGVGG